MGLFFARVGEFAGGAANVASRLSPWISSASGIGRIGVDVFNAGVQHQIITNQLLGNLTTQAGGS
ncbi:MAG TPA: hypothetical protein VFN30_15615, partial [Chitinophagaceae bacterium]|nr:hypothetical protein [Chitinophagaceae bacterium]